MVVVVDGEADKFKVSSGGSGPFVHISAALSGALSLSPPHQIPVQQNFTLTSFSLLEFPMSSDPV